MAQLVHNPSNGSNGTAATASTKPEGVTRDGDGDNLSIEDTLNQLLAGGLSSGKLLCDVFAS